MTNKKSNIDMKLNPISNQGQYCNGMKSNPIKCNISMEWNQNQVQYFNQHSTLVKNIVKQVNFFFCFFSYYCIILLFLLLVNYIIIKLNYYYYY